MRCFLVWLWVWPLVPMAIYVIDRAGLQWPLPLQTLGLTACLVPLVSLVLAPMMQDRALWLISRSRG